MYLHSPVLLILILILTAWTTNTVFLHTCDIEKVEIEKIVNTLQKQAYKIEVSYGNVSVVNFGSFIIYPRDSGNNTPLVKILDAIGDHGYFTNLTAQNRMRNHLYTRKLILPFI